MMNTQQSRDNYFSVSPGKTGVCVCVSSVERFGLSMEEYHAISQNIPNMEFELISSPKAE